MDFQANGHIVDDVSTVFNIWCQSDSNYKLMHQIMVKPLPAGCRLTAIFDVRNDNYLLDMYSFLKIVLSLRQCIG